MIGIKIIKLLVKLFVHKKNQLPKNLSDIEFGKVISLYATKPVFNCAKCSDISAQMLENEKECSVQVAQTFKILESC